jgi:hypothetical protein
MSSRRRGDGRAAQAIRGNTRRAVVERVRTATQRRMPAATSARGVRRRSAYSPAERNMSAGPCWKSPRAATLQTPVQNA